MLKKNGFKINKVRNKNYVRNLTGKALKKVK